MKRTQILQWLVLGGIGVVILGVALAFFVGEGKGNNGVPKANQIAGEGQLPVIKVLDHFSLTNQVGEAVSVSSLKGRPWVANIFFSRCPSFCAQMTQFRLIVDAPGQVLLQLTVTYNYMYA